MQLLSVSWLAFKIVFFDRLFVLKIVKDFNGESIFADLQNF